MDIANYKQKELSSEFYSFLPLVAELNIGPISQFLKSSVDDYTDEREYKLLDSCAIDLVNSTGATISYSNNRKIILCWKEPRQINMVLTKQRLVAIVSTLASGFYKAGLMTMKSLQNDIIDNIISAVPVFNTVIYQVEDADDLTKILVANEQRHTDELFNHLFKNASSEEKDENFGNDMTVEQMREYIVGKGGKDLDDFDSSIKYGSYNCIKFVDRELTDEELENIPEWNRPQSRTITEHSVYKLVVPQMSSVANATQVYFNNEQPVSKQ